MRIPIEMQSLAYDMESAVIIEWLVEIGGHVEKGAPIVIVETEKAEVEMEALELASRQQRRELLRCRRVRASDNDGGGNGGGLAVARLR